MILLGKIASLSDLENQLREISSRLSQLREEERNLTMLQMQLGNRRNTMRRNKVISELSDMFGDLKQGDLLVIPGGDTAYQFVDWNYRDRIHPFTIIQSFKYEKVGKSLFKYNGVKWYRSSANELRSHDWSGWDVESIFQGHVKVPVTQLNYK